MADEAKTVTASQPVFERVCDEPHAPVIFFDGIGPDGHVNGLILLSITAARQIPGEGNTLRVVPTVQAHLRTNIQGAMALRRSIDEALKFAQMQAAMQTPSEGPPN